jgi:hypothetical protein
MGRGRKQYGVVRGDDSRASAQPQGEAMTNLNPDKCLQMMMGGGDA